MIKENENPRKKFYLQWGVEEFKANNRHTALKLNLERMLLVKSKEGMHTYTHPLSLSLSRTQHKIHKDKKAKWKLFTVIQVVLPNIKASAHIP